MSVSIKGLIGKSFAERSKTIAAGRKIPIYRFDPNSAHNLSSHRGEITQADLDIRTEFHLELSCITNGNGSVQATAIRIFEREQIIPRGQTSVLVIR